MPTNCRLTNSNTFFDESLCTVCALISDPYSNVLLGAAKCVYTGYALRPCRLCSSLTYLYFPSRPMMPGSASLMMSSSIAAFDCAHISILTPSAGLGASTIPKLGFLVETSSLAFGAVWPAETLLARMADIMAITVDVFPVPGGPYMMNLLRFTPVQPLRDTAMHCTAFPHGLALHFTTALARSPLFEYPYVLKFSKQVQHWHDKILWFEFNCAWSFTSLGACPWFGGFSCKENKSFMQVSSLSLAADLNGISHTLEFLASWLPGQV